MDPNDKQVEEIAKAVAATAQFGTQTVKATEKILGFISRVFKEPAETTAGIVGDRLKLFQWERQVAYVDKVNGILVAKGVADTRAVYPKYALPILENASLEDQEDIQFLWAKLMANAMDPASQVDLQMAFIEIIKNLTTLDVKILNKIYESLVNSGSDKYEKVLDIIITKDEICKVMSITSKEYEISIFNLFRMQCLAPGVIKATGISFGGEATTIYKGSSAITMTPLGLAFVESCIKA
jgi:hypothetical protein